MQGTWVQSLIGELRSHMPQSKQASSPQLESTYASKKDPEGHNQDLRQSYIQILKKKNKSELPRRSSGYESTLQCREHRLHPWPSKIPHAAELLSLWPQLLNQGSRVCEPQLLSPRAATTEARAPRVYAPKQERTRGHEKAKHGNEGEPPLLQPEKVRATVKTHHSPKIN